LIAKLLCSVLQAEGLEIVVCSSMASATEEIAFAAFQLVIMDFDLYGAHGLQSLRTLQNASTVPVLAMSECAAINATAEDTKPFRILPKPFPLQRLRTSIHEVIADMADGNNPSGSVHFGEFTLDLNQRALSRSGQRISLSPKELAILTDLVEHAGEPRAATTLFARLWGEIDGNKNVVPVYVQRLRRKIEENPSAPSYIQTVHGNGYRFNKFGKKSIA
jgi:DNA-binding response OmpR family regulator